MSDRSSVRIEVAVTATRVSSEYILKSEASVRLSVPQSQGALTVYPSTDYAASTDMIYPVSAVVGS